MRRAVARHYRSLWGRPGRKLNFGGHGVRVQVHHWRAADTDEGVELYATVGASAARMAGRHRVEFILGLTSEVDVAESLAGLGSFPALAGEIDKGDTVTLGGPLWPGSDFRAYLIIPEVDDYLPPLVSRRAHVQFLRAMPIFESEIDLKKEHGAGWVMEELDQRGMRIGDANRRPLS
ncbi:suppressor of fused domain protein [Paractinoplanes maris]|uniref:suppressor of fused domain protein n=1 Tax=Paractinoplanes maris TaxID=1734446 RepID=UPI0020208347|nr:suppressor of fused domain protein [Actinoplanes maris]